MMAFSSFTWNHECATVGPHFTLWNQSTIKKILNDLKVTVMVREWHLFVALKGAFSIEVTQITLFLIIFFIKKTTIDFLNIKEPVQVGPLPLSR